MSGGQPTSDHRQRRLPRIRHVARHRAMRRNLPPLSVLPTLFTLGNLVCGFTAVHYAAKPLDFSGPWGWSSLTIAGLLVFLGMFLDSIDGSVARIVSSESRIGGQLDSLADLVTFGVAPAFMMLRLLGYYLGPEGSNVIVGPEVDNLLIKVIWGVAAGYVCCTALRLARYNLETAAGDGERYTFRGLPSPGAAGAVASLIGLHQNWLAGRGVEDVSLAVARGAAFGIPLVTLLCAIGMISNLPYVHVMNRYLRRRASFAYVARLALVLTLAVWSPWITLSLAFTVYSLSAPFKWISGRRSRGPAASAESETDAAEHASGRS